MYRSDSHVHSEFSGDSKEKLEKIIEKAKELKMDEITITDHLDLDFPMKPNIFTWKIKRIKKKRKRVTNKDRNRNRITTYTCK